MIIYFLPLSQEYLTLKSVTTVNSIINYLISSFPEYFRKHCHIIIIKKSSCEKVNVRLIYFETLVSLLILYYLTSTLYDSCQYPFHESNCPQILAIIKKKIIQVNNKFPNLQYTNKLFINYLIIHLKTNQCYHSRQSFSIIL